MSKKIQTATLTTLTAALLVSSCAGPESYQDKMARYTPKAVGTNLVPEIKTAHINFAPLPSKGRGPASENSTPVKDEMIKEGAPTNKKLYFLSLYDQYETLKKYSSEFVGPSVSICPNFHTSLLRHNEKTEGAVATAAQTKKFTYDNTRFADADYVASRPELLLPLSQDEVNPKVIDVIKSSKTAMTDFAVNELVHKALDIHLAKTYSEIRELCEYGVSDNYYIYENLITHIKNNKFSPDEGNMNILLKTTLFSNTALMTSLEKHKTTTASRSIASVADEKKDGYVGEVMARLNVTWASQYFEHIKFAK